MITKLLEKDVVALAVQETKNKLLTPKDVQSVLNIGKNTTYKLFSLKGFPKIKIGKNYYIDQEAFLKWQKENMNTTICLS